MGSDVDLGGFTCVGNSLSNTDLIFLANITLAGGSDPGVFVFGVMRYTCRNCCSAFSVGVPLAFFNDLFIVSTNLSAIPFDRGWYEGVVICFT